MPVTINGSNTPTAGGVTYGDGTTYANTAAGTTGQALVSAGASAPAFGTLGIAGGGTNSTATATAGGIGYGTGTAHAYTTVGTVGQLLQSNAASAPTWVTVASGLSAASQAEMEAASSNTVAATPLNTNWHPGVVKMWLKCSGDGLTINASHNVTSITDTGTGIVTVTIATDFSSANYSINGTAQSSSSGSPGMKYIHISSQAAGSFVGTSGVEPSMSGPSDPLSYYFACLGDQ